MTELASGDMVLTKSRRNQPQQKTVLGEPERLEQLDPESPTSREVFMDTTEPDTLVFRQTYAGATYDSPLSRLRSTRRLPGYRMDTVIYGNHCR